jgi:hypothetical protein
VLALVIVLGVAVLLLGVLVVGLLRSHAEILRRLHELGAGVYEADDGSDAGAGVTSSVALTERPEIRTQEGVAAPRPDDTPAFDLAGSTPEGAAKAVGVVGVAHSTLIAFLSSGCGTCGDFWRAFAEGEADRLPGRDTRLVIVTKGPDEESPAAVAQLAPPGSITLMSSQAFSDYGVPVSPYVILVDGPEGRVVGEGAAASWAQVANLLRQAAADAGLVLDDDDAAAGQPPRRLDGPGREARADEELLRAGIAPGDPSLYPDRITEPAVDDRPTGASAPPSGRR